MTEDVLNAAITKLKSLALEQYAMIKDKSHQPMSQDTISTITNCALNLAQLEGAMITLQQYSGELAKRTPAELAADPLVPDEPMPEDQQADEIIGHDELMKRSPTYRKSIEDRERMTNES